MNNDGIFSIIEKQSIRTQWEAIWGATNTTTHNTTGSYAVCLTRCGTFGLSTTNLTSNVNALKTFLNNNNLNTKENTTGFVREDLSKLFKENYKAT